MGCTAGCLCYEESCLHVPSDFVVGCAACLEPHHTANCQCCEESCSHALSRLRPPGIRDKVLAAYRSGITTVLLPLDNKDQTEELPAEVHKNVWFVYVDSVMQALEALFPLSDVAVRLGVGGYHGDSGTGSADVRVAAPPPSAHPTPLIVDDALRCRSGADGDSDGAWTTPEHRHDWWAFPVSHVDSSWLRARL